MLTLIGGGGSPLATLAASSAEAASASLSNRLNTISERIWWKGLVTTATLRHLHGDIKVMIGPPLHEGFLPCSLSCGPSQCSTRRNTIPTAAHPFCRHMRRLKTAFSHVLVDWSSSNHLQQRHVASVSHKATRLVWDMVNILTICSGAESSRLGSRHPRQYIAGQSHASKGAADLPTAHPPLRRQQPLCAASCPAVSQHALRALPHHVGLTPLHDHTARVRTAEQQVACTSLRCNNTVKAASSFQGRWLDEYSPAVTSAFTTCPPLPLDPSTPKWLLHDTLFPIHVA